jgi:hypothetical protein
VIGTLTPSADTKDLSFPCGDIKTVLCMFGVFTDFENYISSENNGLGLGLFYMAPKYFFNNRDWTGSTTGQRLAVYNGAFDYWSASYVPRIDEANQIATFQGHNNATFRAGLPIEYVMMGV